MALTSLVAAHAAAAAAGAGKKAAQVQLQAELNTDEDWNKFLARDGLLVVDVYSEWCGPCIGMVGNLKKIKVEIGGDNLHLAIARADTIECLKRFRKRSEPTWMFIAGGQLLNVVFGADAPRLARTIERELRAEDEVRRGLRARDQRAPHQLTPDEQAVAEAQQKRLEEKQARELAALRAAREARRAERAQRLDAHFADLCPALLLPHAQKHLRKVADALDAVGVAVADKCPLVVGAETARALAAEEPALAGAAAAGALCERPALTLLLRRQPDAQGHVIELVRRALCGEGVEEAPAKTVSSELYAGEVPGLFVPADTQQRAVALDLLFPKLVSSAVEPPAPAPPPHVLLVFGAWQRRAVLSAAPPAPETASPAPGSLLRYGFFADADVSQPRLLAKTLDKYEERPEKDYCETLALMVSVGSAEQQTALAGPPSPLLALGPLHVSEDAVSGERECAAFFPPGYAESPRKPKPKTKKKKKKRESKEETVEDPSAERSAAGGEAAAERGGEGEAEVDGEAGAEGEVEGEAEGEGEGEVGEGEAEEEEDGESAGVDKATSPPPQTPH